ncbi:hypothetical protein [Micromonospora sp. NPDC023888]|uniref:hypothetical protein n=1 Tax=Micromonospora sp. NPDC023888 TaxID=3155607 RepID=UPI0033DD202E
MLASGPLRLAVTDQHLACLVRPGMVPDDIRARFTDSQRLLAPLTGHEAHEVLRLIRWSWSLNCRFSFRRAGPGP